MKYYRLAILALAALFAASCAEPLEDARVEMTDVRLEGYADEVGTKSAPLASMPSAFTCWSYVNDGTPSYMCRETMTKSGSVWVSALKHGTVPAGTNLRYYGLAPYNASYMTVPAYNTTWANSTLVYTCPAASTSQEDIIVADSGLKSGSAAAVSMTFSHILCQVRIHTAFDNVPAGSVTTVSLTNVGYSGTYKFSTGAWTVSGTRTMTYTASQTLTASSENVQIGTDAQTFMLIPQTLPSTCNLQVRVGSTTYTKSMSGVVLTMGRRVILRIVFNAATSISTGNDTDGAPEYDMDVKVEYED